MSEQEFTDIYRRQADRVYTICCFYLGNPTDAQDAAQNVFIKLLEKRDGFCDPKHEEAWLYTVARNHCRDILRSGWRKKRVDMQIPDDMQQSQMQKQTQEREGAWHEEGGGSFAQAFSKIPIKQKEVLYLYYYEEYSVKEISKILRRKESTIQSQLAAGRKKLKKQFTKKGASDEGNA